MKNSLLAVAFLLVFAVTSPAQSKSEIESLKGVTSIAVLVENIEPDVEASGLTRQQIKTDVELRLRQARIKVRGLTDFGDESATLYININLLALENGLIAYCNGVEFQQIVAIERKPSKRSLMGTTWSKGGVGIVSKQNARSIRNALADVVDSFINDFLAVNPK